MPESDTSALVAFLEARLQEDELWALAASSPDSWRGNHPPIPTGVRWTWAVGDDWEPYEIDPLEEHIGESVDAGSPTLVTVDEFPYPEPSYGRTAFRHDVISYAEEVRTVDGAHIARHDPARVLREAAAKRRIIEVAVAQLKAADLLPDGHRQASAARALGILQLLTAPYVDHPDFNPQWLTEENPTDA